MIAMALSCDPELLIADEPTTMLDVSLRLELLALLEEAAAFAGDRLILGGREPGRRNLSDALNAALSADTSLPRLEAGRLRASWLCECARLIGLAAFMAAAGIRCSQRLGDLVAELPEPGEKAAVALLGGADESAA